MAASIHFDDLTPEQRKQLGVKAPRQTKFSAEQMRSWALRTLAAMAGLTRLERDRVLRHAIKVNRL